MGRTRTFLAVLSLLIGTSEAQAHEFWIAPERHMIDAGGDIIADIRVGQNFSGDARPLLPFSYERLDIISGGKAEPVAGRMGDMPAVNMPASGPGLATVVAVTKGVSVNYKTLDDFKAFLVSKGISGVLEDHRARGLPQANFPEKYRRFAKSLIAIGRGEGKDEIVGLESEIVAEANPYFDDVSGGLPVQVLFQGAPLGDNQLDIFARDEAGDVTYTSMRTDKDGRALVPVTAGTDYLLDTVVMQPASASDFKRDPVWLSFWASLTFRVPAPSETGRQ
ncbi:MAG: DUF4198 domain-containing protein [Rhizobiales bacterium]|nr:DUF4198 domain-containing protein [Hyphomicrobiales bacterium]